MIKALLAILLLSPLSFAQTQDLSRYGSLARQQTVRQNLQLQQTQTQARQRQVNRRFRDNTTTLIVGFRTQSQRPQSRSDRYVGIGGRQLVRDRCNLRRGVVVQRSGASPISGRVRSRVVWRR